MPPQNQTWTILAILNATSDYFLNHAIENPRLNAERLLAHTLNCDRLDLYLQFERILDSREMAHFRKLVKRRAGHEPLQYLTGETEFMGFPFSVNSSVLIPRPETELLVESVLRLKAEYESKNPLLWDIGTGSGCIAVSLARMWSGLQVVASDISREALRVAEDNATRNNVRDSITFYEHDILKDEKIIQRDVDIIVSNPPYISKQEITSLPSEIRDHEPEIALTDNKDGFEFYRRIMSVVDQYPTCRFILLEMSGTQPGPLKDLVADFHRGKFSTTKDLNGFERVLKIKL
jgi:release factor glutamine methyltransferase